MGAYSEDYGIQLHVHVHIRVYRVTNPSLTNDSLMRHDLSELSISLWELIWGFYY